MTDLANALRALPGSIVFAVVLLTLTGIWINLIAAAEIRNTRRRPNNLEVTPWATSPDKPTHRADGT